MLGTARTGRDSFAGGDALSRQWDAIRSACEAVTMARHWDGVVLLMSWLAAAGGYWLARWTLKAGTYRGSLEGSEIAEIQGLWTPAFASGGSVVVFVVTASAIGFTGVRWITGRKDRDAMNLAVKSGHRRLLK